MVAGEAKVGSIYKDGLVEKQLKIGDSYTIPVAIHIDGSCSYRINVWIVSTFVNQNLTRIINVSTFVSQNPTHLLFVLGRPTRI